MIKLSAAQRKRIGLQYVLDLVQPVSAYGRAALRELKFFTPERKADWHETFDNIEKTIRARQLHETAYMRLEQMLAGVRDIRHTIERLADSAPDEVELFEIKRYLLQLSEMQPLLSEIDADAQYAGIHFEKTSQALDLLDPDHSRIASFYTSERYSPALAQARKEKREIERQMNLSAKPDRELENKRQLAAAAEQTEEQKVHREIGIRLQPHINAMLHNTGMISELDLSIQKAKLAVQHRCARPQTAENELELVNMINPMVAAQLEKNGGSFTAVSMVLPKGATVITGANMGGKSVALKTIALQVALAHLGFYIFADSAKIPFFDSIDLVSEDLEAADRGLSSFGGEILRLNEIAEEMSKGFSLVLLDEFARGTNPDEGAALAKAATAFFNAQQAITVLATHFDGIAAAGGAHYQVTGLGKVDFAALEKELAATPQAGRVAQMAKHMNYGLVRVDKDTPVSRDALAICKLLNCPKEIMDLVDLSN